MEIFKMYLQLGFQHIADFAGYDHILFIAMLCAVYSISQWKKILVLITAFTFGHSVTLALSTVNILDIPLKIIEFLIPITILITAITNILQNNLYNGQNSYWIKYTSAFFFGLIHGLGFSFYLKSLLGEEVYILLPLFSFNIGIESGQLIIVFILIVLSFILLKLFRISERLWSLILSVAGIGISLLLIVKRFPWK